MREVQFTLGGIYLVTPSGSSFGVNSSETVGSKSPLSSIRHLINYETVMLHRRHRV